MAEEFSSPPVESKSKMNPWLVVVIVAAILLCCCLVVFLLLPSLLSLLAPVTGNVFSNIIEEIATPMP